MSTCASDLDFVTVGIVIGVPVGFVVGSHGKGGQGLVRADKISKR